MEVGSKVLFNPADFVGGEIAEAEGIVTETRHGLLCVESDAFEGARFWVPWSQVKAL